MGRSHSLASGKGRLAATLGVLSLVLLASAVPARSQSRQRPSQSRTLRFTEPMTAPILVGTVLLEDGSPPPESVVVQRVCGGSPPVPEAYTNTKGRFSIDLARDPSLQLDAEYGLSSRAQERDLSGCELRADLPGYSSDAIDLSMRRGLDNPDVGTIVLRRLEGVTGSVFSMTALRASRDARRAFEKGHELVMDEKLDQAREEYEKAVRLAPGFASAWYELGLVHEMQHRVEDAHAAYGEAVAADSEYVKPYRRLSTLAFDAQRWQEVAETAGRIVELDPVSYADAHLQLAAASFFLGEVERAERGAREAIRLDSGGSIPNARYLLGVVLLESGDHPGAAQYLREYVAMASPGPDVERAEALLAQLGAASTDR
jgi:tetratricopeptide (TPR) repeat protein